MRGFKEEDRELKWRVEEEREGGKEEDRRLGEMDDKNKGEDKVMTTIQYRCLNAQTITDQLQVIFFQGSQDFVELVLAGYACGRSSSELQRRWARGHCLVPQMVLGSVCMHTYNFIHKFTACVISIS